MVPYSNLPRYLHLLTVTDPVTEMEVAQAHTMELTLLWTTSFSNNFTLFQLKKTQNNNNYKKCWPYYMVSIQNGSFGKQIYKETENLNHFVS